MKLGLHISSFTWPGGQASLTDDLVALAKAAEDAGFDRVSVMDHVFQIYMIGPSEQEMLEAYATLGFLAAHTSRVKLLTLVSAVTYRSPGLLAKIITTLDVLSKGRAMLGIGAAWNEEESKGLDLFLPPLAERYERLEETLQICQQMWSGKDAPYEGKYFHLERTLNSPSVVSKPHPPILIGGTGEKKTLRLVAQYAQACNFFPGGDLQHSLDVLKRHCDDVGRNYDDIEKTVGVRFEVGPNGEGVDETIATLEGYSQLGFTIAHGSVMGDHKAESLQVIGEQIVPVIEAF